MRNLFAAAAMFLLLSMAGAAPAVISAPVPKTGQTLSYDPRDDGALEIGVAWPSPRFVDHGNGTITDLLTGLTWLKDASCFGQRSWTNALNDANTLSSGSCGLTDGSQAGDWRLPNVREMHSLINFGRTAPALPTEHPFTGVESGQYWTSTTLAESLTSHAWFVNLYSGEVYHGMKSDTEWVWPVRGQTSGPAPVPRSGQSLCYNAVGTVIDCAGTGQDGEYIYGIAWPVPRFKDNGDGTVLDRLTGLTWLKNANCFDTISWMYALEDTSELASGWCGLTDGSQAGDWRMSNLRELYSLIDFGNRDPALPDGHPFLNTNDNTYWWTSTTDPRYAGDAARVVTPMSGRISTVEKLHSQNFWPVRGEVQTRIYLPCIMTD